MFDRLVDVAPGAPSGHIISRATLQESVAREVASILNTRIDPAIDAIDPLERTVLEYGLPDFTALAAASGADMSRLATACERAITAFEPRLAKPRVEIAPEKKRRDSVSFIIAGVLTVNGAPESFTFPVDLGPAGSDSDAG